MLHSEFSVAPLLFLAAFAVMSSLSKRKPRSSATPRPLEPDTGFMSELQRAMRELEQAQQQQRIGGSLKLPGPPTPQEQHAAQWLADQKARKALKPTGRVRSSRAVVPLDDDDADKSSEGGASLEGQDYDEDAEKVISARRDAAEHRVQRTDESSETLSTLQQARRASRAAVAIGGEAEHAAWHGEIRSVETGKTVETVKRAGKLGRFADGTARSAIILGEILRPPVGQRGA